MLEILHCIGQNLYPISYSDPYKKLAFMKERSVKRKWFYRYKIFSLNLPICRGEGPYKYLKGIFQFKLLRLLPAMPGRGRGVRADPADSWEFEAEAVRAQLTQTGGWEQRVRARDHSQPIRAFGHVHRQSRITQHRPRQIAPSGLGLFLYWDL